MFYRGINPVVRDPVDIPVAGDEPVRWVAVWKRPNKAVRRELAAERMADGIAASQLEARLKAAISEADPAALEQLVADTQSEGLRIEERSKDRIRAHLERIDGIEDEGGNPVAFTPDILEQLLAWDEFYLPLSLSLGRLTDGSIVEEAATKNSLMPAGTGLELDFPPEVLIRQEPLPSTMPSTTASADA